VLEYLIDNYCSEETFDEDFQRVKRRLRENVVHGAEAERTRHYIRENCDHTLIASLEVRLVETEDKYWGTIGAINETYVNVPEAPVKQYPMLLATDQGCVQVRLLHSADSRMGPHCGAAAVAQSLVQLPRFIAVSPLLTPSVVRFPHLIVHRPQLAYPSGLWHNATRPAA